MRNCEQILGSLGLFAYRVERLDQLDEALSDFGPEIDGGFQLDNRNHSTQQQRCKTYKLHRFQVLNVKAMQNICSAQRFTIT